MKFLKKYDLDSDFYKRYVSLIQNTGKIKTGTQVVSAITGIAVWYALANSNLVQFFGWWAFIPSTIFALLVAVGIEVGLRRFLPYGVRAFIHKRWKGLDGAMSGFIIPICCALLVASGYTSFQGSTTVVQAIAPDVELKTTTATDSVYTTKVSANNQTFASDSLTIATTFNNQIQATAKKFDTKILSSINKAEQLQERASRTKTAANKSWLKVLAGRAIDKADNYTFAKDSIVADLEGFKASKLLTLLDNRRTDKIGADTTYIAATTKIIASNELAVNENQNLIDSYGSGLGWITVVCLIVFIFLTILEEIHRKGSDQTEQVVYSQLDLLPSVWDRWTNYINELVLGAIHRKLAAWESNLQPLPMPEPLSELYVLGDQEQQKIQVGTTLPYDQGFEKIFDSSNNGQTAGIDERDLYDFTDFSRNKKSDKNITATVEAPPTSSEDLEFIFDDDFKGVLGGEDGTTTDTSKIGRIGDRMPISSANLDNDRNKEKHKKKQKKRIVKYYKSYLKKYKKKPSYQTISDALNIAVRSVGEYVRELKKAGEL